jgi:hypothetical protein
MNPKKQKEKDRRRARKLADEAWEAVDAGNLDLAEKIIRRAVTAQIDNPVLWIDQGAILALRGKEAESADAFRAALSLAPTFAEAYDRLAALRVRQGFTTEAAALQGHAVRHAPDETGYADRLVAYRALAGGENTLMPHPPAPLPSVPDLTAAILGDDPPGGWAERLAALDWEQIGERLTRDGYAVIEHLVDGRSCERLCELFEQDDWFAKTVVMDRPAFGLGVYRYFRAPVPASIEGLRRAVYPFVSGIANGWERLLGKPERFPAEWDAFREECHNAGQIAPTPILLRYGPGGFNALHRDLRGAVYFPVQMAVVLNRNADTDGPGPDGFRGGAFLLCDVPEGRKARRREVPAGRGDTVLFCTRDRLVRVGGAYGLQPVKHGAARVEAGTRFVLGLPFHEYR